MDKQIRLGIILNLILIFAFFIRIYHLGTNPPELFSDEITQVLSARSIIENGYDVDGKLNLFLYNKIKLGTPISGYLSAISTYLIGNTSFGVRLPAAIFGVLSVYLIYLLTLHFTKNKLSSLFVAFLSSITPWAIYFSRIGWEPAMTIPFLLLSIYLLLKSIDANDKKKLLLSYIFFAISVYASDAAEFLSPVFILIIIAVNIKQIFANKKGHLIGIFIFSLLMTPLIYVSLTNPLKHDRALKISTFKEGLNKQSVTTFINNYATHFSPKFLFETGDPNLRHGTGQDGVLYWIYLPFILTGLFYILKNPKDKNNIFLIAWLLIFPLGGSLTNDGAPHATRTLIGMPIFAILAGIGMSKFSKIFLFVAMGIAVIEFGIFWKSYFTIYPINSQPWWEYGQKEVFKTVKENTKGNETLCLGNTEYWHEETLVKYYFGVNHQYDYIYDINDPSCLSREIVVLPVGFEPNNNYYLIKTVYSLEGNPIWNIYKSL